MLGVATVSGGSRASVGGGAMAGELARAPGRRGGVLPWWRLQRVRLGPAGLIGAPALALGDDDPQDDGSETLDG